jgi:putative DNA methylase
MIPRECKRLAEVDFPIAVVSKHAVREKSINHGHPRLLHLWWARRPLASCRAMLLALLLPDPCDRHCPVEFKAKARQILRPVPGRVGNSDEELHEALLRFIGDFANWDHAANPTFLEAGRALVKSAHPDETTLVVDPFAGGGSIPLEALRLGCDAFASDLNPVACLILETLLEDIPRHGPGLADELRHVGAGIKAAAERELGQFYPPDPDGAKPIAYLWARTVRCEAPSCGAEIPIFRSAWLSKKGVKRARYFKEAEGGDCSVLLVEGSPLGGPIQFRISRGYGSEDARLGYSEPISTKAKGNNANVICPCCGNILPGNKKNPRTSIQLSQQRGGADVIFDGAGNRIGGARLLAVVTLHSNYRGRQYRLPTEHDYATVQEATAALQHLITGSRNEIISPIPNEPTPRGGGSGASRAFSVQRYGMAEWGDLFSARQKIALVVISRLISRAGADARLAHTLSMALSRCAEQLSSLVRWRPTVEAVAGTFGRQALPIMWDFAEIVPTGDDGSNFGASIEWVAESAEVHYRSVNNVGQIQAADATVSPLPDDTAAVWFTDPPYYDAVPYADLSDFFFVWLKRALPGDPLLRDLFDAGNSLTPKIAEIVQDETKLVGNEPKDRTFFEQAMARAFAEGRRVVQEDGIGSVVFAHKTTEGWEALLSGMIQGGWVITGSWPVATERPGRLRSQNSAALATSIHLVCRPRTEDKTGDWADVLRELPERVGEWMVRLDREGVRGADLVFACIGPALEIFSRYSRVETADGREVPLAEYLEKVWEVVGREALHQVLGTAEAQARNGGAGALEEDARLTALFLWTIRSTAGNGADEGTAEEDEEGADAAGEEDSGSRKAAKGFALIYDIVRRFAQPLGIHLQTWEGRIIETDKGVVRLLPVAERAGQLFGAEGAAGLADRIDHTPAMARQLELFPEPRSIKELQPRARRRRFAATAAAAREATTLDRVHTAMLLQASGRANALRALLAAEQERGPDFLRLGNALSALYPQGSEEKRLLDAMLLAVPR